MIDAHLQTPKIRTLAYRDPVGVSTQLRDLGDTLTERGVHTPAGIRLLFRAACDYGECGARGIKYWTPNYENLGWNVVPLLFQLRELKQEGHVRRWLRECLNSFVKAIAADPAVDSDPEAAVDRHYDFAVSMAASINVGDEGATAMPQYLLSRSDDLPEAVVNWAKTKMNAALP